MFRTFFCLIGLGVFFGAVGIRAQNKDETIRVETRLVSVPTVVSDRNGRYIPNLLQSDFKVFQDGVEQKIEFFAATEEPINVALLIDTSQSTRPVLDDIKDSARAFIKFLTPKDKAMVVTFDYQTTVLCSLTSDQEHLKGAIRRAEIPERGSFGTTLRDAVHETISGAFRGLTGRKAIILLTDGKDAGSQIRVNDLLYRLEETDTLIYTVMFKTGNGQPQMLFERFPRGRGGIFRGQFPPVGSPNPQNQRRNNRVEQQNERAQEFLESLSDITAGRFFSSKDGKLKGTFASIVEELRFQYRLGFYPPEDNGSLAVHSLKVKVARSDVAVRSRASYRTESK